VIRVVLGVVLAVALLTAATPGVERARVAESETALDRSADALRRATAGLAADDATAVGVRGARRIVTVRVPGRPWAEAAVDYLAVGCEPARCATADAGSDRMADSGAAEAESGSEGRGRVPGDAADVVSYRIRGRSARRVRASGIDLRFPDGPIVLTEPGRHRLTLALARDGAEPVVVVRRGLGSQDTPTGG
jgi:hypothetical protein